jgi:hypothetical protein
VSHRAGADGRWWWWWWWWRRRECAGRGGVELGEALRARVDWGRKSGNAKRWARRHRRTRSESVDATRGSGRWEGRRC